MFLSAPVKEVSRWFNSTHYFTAEKQGRQFPRGFDTIKILKSLVRRYTIKAVGPANQPGYICVIRKENQVRIGFSRRPKSKLKQVGHRGEAQELVWYGFTENMLAAKQAALAYFVDHRTNGDWLKITPLIAMTYFKNKR